LKTTLDLAASHDIFAAESRSLADGSTSAAGAVVLSVQASRYVVEPQPSSFHGNVTVANSSFNRTETDAAS